MVDNVVDHATCWQFCLHFPFPGNESVHQINLWNWVSSKDKYFMDEEHLWTWTLQIHCSWFQSSNSVIWGWFESIEWSGWECRKHITENWILGKIVSWLILS